MKFSISQFLWGKGVKPSIKSKYYNGKMQITWKGFLFNWFTQLAVPRYQVPWKTAVHGEEFESVGRPLYGVNMRHMKKVLPFTSQSSNLESHFIGLYTQLFWDVIDRHWLRIFCICFWPICAFNKDCLISLEYLKFARKSVPLTHKGREKYSSI